MSPAQLQRADATAGSVLVEALVAIGMLGALLVSVAGVHGSAVTALSGAQSRAEAIRRAEWVLEHRASGLPIGLEPGEHVELLRTPLEGDPCGDTEGAGVSILRVHVPVGGRDGGMVLAGPAGSGANFGSEGGERATPAHVRVTTELDPSVTVTIAGRDDGDLSVRGVGATFSCIAGLAVEPGFVEVRLDEGEGPALLDPLHRRASDAPMPLSILDQGVRRTWDLDRAASIVVGLDPASGRAADMVLPHGLGWLVRGDDARRFTPIGEPRAVHPGRITVVVSACASTQALASPHTVEVTAGSTLQVDVATASLEVRGVAGRSDATLRLNRAEGCRDGSGASPSLWWFGGLQEGMRIAVPHGVWNARLETSSGGPLTAYTQIGVGEPGSMVVFP